MTAPPTTWVADVEEYEDVTSLLIDMRLRAGLTQEQLADRMEVCPKTVRRVERMERPPNLRDARLWAYGCGRSLVLEDVER